MDRQQVTLGVPLHCSAALCTSQANSFNQNTRNSSTKAVCSPRAGAAQPQCRLDLAVPCRDANGTEHHSAVPALPIAWRFAPTPPGGLFGTAGLDSGAFNATREVPFLPIHCMHSVDVHKLKLHSCHAVLSDRLT